MSRKSKVLVIFICMILTGVLCFVESSQFESSVVQEPLVPNEEVILETVESSNQFYENQGQIDVADILFYGSIPGGTIGFGESKCYLWMEGSRGWIVLSFVGSRPVQPTGIDTVDHLTNYFLGDRGTYTNVQGFHCIKYNDLWSGIDLQYVMSVDGAKYEFLVAPGANPDDICIQSEGHDVLSLEPTGLRIQRDDGVLIDEGLRVYQSHGDIEASLISYNSDSFGFDISSYDESETLVIDPLLYSTYIGGESEDRGYGIEVDDSGNVYVTGRTYSTGFPTFNAYDDIQGGYSDCFVLKLNTTGNEIEILYSTFIGGGATDYANSIAVDGNGNAYVTGQTASSDFPVQNFFDNSHNGGNYDCFVFKLSATGDSLIYSTYIGGDDDDVGTAIVIDDLFNAYVTGHTSSSNFPTQTPIYTDSGYIDVFILKLDPDGDILIFSTYIAGEWDDSGYGIAIDANSNIYVTGKTSSSISFPKVNAYDDTNNGNNDCFVLKLNSTGTSIIYSTFVGGTNADVAWGIAVDSSFNAYVTGNTESGNFPLENEYDSAMNGASDCFILKLNATGNGLHYSTFIGGGENEAGLSIDLDSSNRACITGWVASTDFPTVNPYDGSPNGNIDCFVVRMNADGNVLDYATYIGGENSDTGRCITISDNNMVYITGDTFSEQFPIFRAYLHGPQGDFDCFVFGLDLYGVDSEGPLMQAYLPNPPSGENDIYIHVRVTDASGVDSVTLSYSVNDESSWINVTMTIDTIPNRYIGYVPNAACVGEDTVFYKVYATDILDNEDVSDISQFMVLDGEPTGPEITDINFSPMNPSQASQVTVGATITDYSGVAEAKLAYSFDTGSTWINVTMTNTAGNTWSGTIPNKTDGGQVDFKIYARDNVGYWTESETNNYGVFMDSNEPNIWDIGWDEGSIRPDESVIISATVEDETSIAQVILYYSIDEQSSWVPVNMSFIEHENRWEGSIPGQPDGTTVYLYIYAEDDAGNYVESEVNSYYVSESTLPQNFLMYLVTGSGVIFLLCICGSVLRRRRRKAPVPMVPPVHVAVPTDIKAMRGGEIVGGRFDYKVKVKNESEYVINNVTVAIIAYPKDCMTLEGDAVKTLTRIEPGGFRSPQFVFTPSKDCVEGEILATISYVDIHNDPQTLSVEPYTIRSVCDLLTPLETTMDQFDLVLGDMTATSEEHELEWNSEVLFQKAKLLLPTKNFHIIEATGQTDGGLFAGIITGLAEGKYTGKRVAVRIRISGKAKGHKSKVVVEGLGDDLAMIPTTIDEISTGIESWLCLTCGAGLDPNEVTQIKAKIPIQCRYCGKTLTLDLYVR